MTILSDPLGRLDRFGADVASEPWILIRWYRTSIHSKISVRASSCVRKRWPWTSSFFKVAQWLFFIGVVVAVAGTAHALRHAMLLGKFSKGMTCILHSSGSTSRLVGSCLISSRHDRDGMRRGLGGRSSMISITALTFARRPCSAIAADLCTASASARFLR